MHEQREYMQKTQYKLKIQFSACLIKTANLYLEIRKVEVTMKISLIWKQKWLEMELLGRKFLGIRD